jgi:hypothetical protein
MQRRRLKLKNRLQTMIVVPRAVFPAVAVSETAITPTIPKIRAAERDPPIEPGQTDLKEPFSLTREGFLRRRLVSTGRKSI